MSRNKRINSFPHTPQGDILYALSELGIYLVDTSLTQQRIRKLEAEAREVANLLETATELFVSDDPWEMQFLPKLIESANKLTRSIRGGSIYAWERAYLHAQDPKQWLDWVDQFNHIAELCAKAVPARQTKQAPLHPTAALRLQSAHN